MISSGFDFFDDGVALVRVCHDPPAFPSRLQNRLGDLSPSGVRDARASRSDAGGAPARSGAVGTVVGLFFMPIGLVAGPFLGAFCGELIAGRKIVQAAKGGLGAFLGFVAGTLIKLVVCFAMLGWAVFHL